MDNKIAYISGFIFTTAMTMTIYDILMAAVVGLVGGFFGILGKDIYYWIKKKLNGI
jgi:hypothetical protein